MTQTAQIHRFRDKVAIHVGSGNTVYLTGPEAYRLGSAIKDCARATEYLEYGHDDDFKTFNMQFNGEKNNNE